MIMTWYLISYVILRIQQPLEEKNMTYDVNLADSI